MPEEKQKGRIKDFVGVLSRWLGSDERAVDDTAVPPSSISSGGLHDKPEIESHSGGKDSAFERYVEPETEPECGLSFPAANIREKLVALRKAFEFDVALKAGLEEIQTFRDLTLYLHETLLSRFSRLRDVGFVGNKSMSVIDAMDDKIGALLAMDEVPPVDEANLDVEALSREVTELRQQIKNLHTTYVKGGVISEREIALAEENRHLQRRVREQRSQLSLARRHLKALSTSQELARSLRARNSLLRSKVDRQEILLRTLTLDNPRHQELLTTIDRLSTDNQQLRLEIEGQSELIQQFQSHLPAGARNAVGELVKKHSGLFASWGSGSTETEALFARTFDDKSNDALLQNVERLNEENAQLKQMLETRRMIDRFLKSGDEAGDQADNQGELKRIIEALKMENHRLEQVVRSREQQLKSLAADPQNRPLVKALIRLRDENQQILKENAHKDQIYRKLAAEKNELQKRFQDKHALIRENRVLKAELESNGRLLEAAKKREANQERLKQAYSELRRENSELRSKLDATLAQYRNLAKKLEKMTVEYNLLVREYENIFERK